MTQAHPLPVIEGLEDLQLVGRGGFGAVYRARQPRFDRTVAVKVIDVRSGTDLQQQFERECRALGKLSGQPNIVTVFDAGQTPDGRPYLVMQYLPGGSLQSRLDERGSLRWTEVAAIGVKMAAALAAAHRHGVIHRDVKPENILLNAAGEPYLVDFGIARVLERSGTFTLERAHSAYHAAPEVFRGEARTEASDVYSLGSTLYHLLAGRPAFFEDTDESPLAGVTRALSDPPPDLRRSGLPDQLVATIERALAKQPADRQPGAAALAGELQAALDSAPPEDDEERTTQWLDPPRDDDPPRGRNRLVMAGAAAGGLLAVVVVGGLLWPGWWAASSTTTSSSTTSTTQPTRSTTEPTRSTMTTTSTTTTTVPPADPPQALLPRALEPGDVITAGPRGLAVETGATFDLDLPGAVGLALADGSGGVVYQLVDDDRPGDIVVLPAAATAPDVLFAQQPGIRAELLNIGRTAGEPAAIYLVQSDAELATAGLHLHGLETGMVTVLSLEEVGGEGGALAVSLVGDRLAVTADAEGLTWFEFYDVAAGRLDLPNNPRPFDEDRGASLGPAALTPDGGRLVFPEYEGDRFENTGATLVIADLTAGTETAFRLTDEPTEVTRLDTNGLLALVTLRTIQGSHHARLVDLADGEVLDLYSLADPGSAALVPG